MLLKTIHILVDSLAPLPSVINVPLRAGFGGRVAVHPSHLEGYLHEYVFDRFYVDSWGPAVGLYIWNLRVSAGPWQIMDLGDEV